MIKFISLSIGAIVLSFALAQAQAPTRGNAGRIYDPATETTVKGAIEAVTQVANGRMVGTHIALKVDDQIRNVVLGPSGFISNRGFSFGKGDSIEVTGSRVTVTNTDYIIAREVVKEGKTLKLRDKSGIPEWSGSRRVKP
jgi:hypothetical protein